MDTTLGGEGRVGRIVTESKARAGSLSPTAAGLPDRGATVPLDPQVRSAAAVTSAFSRFGDQLEQTGHRVMIDETGLHAMNHAGVFYRTLSPLARLTRGEVSVWRHRDELRLDLRPDWLAAMGDVAVAAVLSAWFRNPWSGAFQIDAAFLAVIWFLMFASVTPLLRMRYATMLSRALWLSDDQWESARDRAITRRSVLKWVRRAALGIAGTWWLYTFREGAWWQAGMVLRTQPLFAALLAGSILVAMAAAFL